MGRKGLFRKPKNHLQTNHGAKVAPNLGKLTHSALA